MPVPVDGGDRYRVYYSSRDEKGRASAHWIETSKEDPTKIIARSQKPFLERGASGSFDENGVMVCSEGYYIGWRVDGTSALGSVSSRQLVFENSDCVGPAWVMGNMMWYGKGTWRGEDLFATINLAVFDGSWKEYGIVLEDGEAAARPCVQRTKAGYEMFYSKRSAQISKRDYRIGYAYSADGKTWVKQPSGLEPSASGWDSEMVCYACPIDNFVFYNGNGFGESGLGVAVR